MLDTVLQERLEMAGYSWGSDKKTMCRYCSVRWTEDERRAFNKGFADGLRITRRKILPSGAIVSVANWST